MSQRPPFSPARPLPPDTRKGKGSFMRAAGSFVPKLTAKVFERYGFHSAEIMTAWARVAGEDIARITKPERIKWPRGVETDADGLGGAGAGATLILRTEPAHALDVEYRAREIMDRINRYFGYRAVASLKIIQAPLPSTNAPEPPAPPLPAAAVPPAPLPEPIAADAELKGAFDALWASIAAERARRAKR